VALAQGREVRGKLVDVGIGCRGEFVHPGVEGNRVFGGHALVWPEGGQHLDLEAALPDLPVVFERIGGVVGSADHAYVHPSQQAAHRVVGALQQGRGLVVDFAGRVAVEYFGDAEVAAQFQVRPVVEGVAHRVGHGFGPLLEPGVVVGIAGDVAFRYAVGAQGPPLVMVAVEPDAGQVGKPLVGGNLVGGQVTVVVDDGHAGRVFVVEVAGRVGLEQEVFGKKGLAGGGYIGEHV
jgi:hypothetical protein